MNTRHGYGHAITNATAFCMMTVLQGVIPEHAFSGAFGGTHPTNYGNLFTASVLV
jgi:hypothetical protein